MGRPANKPVVDEIVETSVENMEDVSVDVVDEAKKVNEEKTKNVENLKAEPLKDSDEIKVVSLVPNVSYKDSKTHDMYEWLDIGHVEPMSFETLKNMWRNNKGYFKNLWLKPNDARVINQFGLNKTFEKYEYLMEPSNYTKKNINSICNAISETPNGLKFSICDKIKSMVVDGEVTDVSVIKALEKHLKIDLIEFLD